MSLSSDDLQLLADRTEGYSGSDIAHLASEALLRPVRDLDRAQYWLPVNGQQLQPCSPSLPGAIQNNLCNFLPQQVVLCGVHYYHYITIEYGVGMFERCGGR